MLGHHYLATTLFWVLSKMHFEMIHVGVKEKRKESFFLVAVNCTDSPPGNVIVHFDPACTYCNLA